jgi:hypothetical protein
MPMTKAMPSGGRAGAIEECAPDFEAEELDRPRSVGTAPRVAEIIGARRQAAGQNGRTKAAKGRQAEPATEA